VAGARHSYAQAFKQLFNAIESLAATKGSNPRWSARERVAQTLRTSAQASMQRRFEQIDV